MTDKPQCLTVKLCDNLTCKGGRTWGQGYKHSYNTKNNSQSRLNFIIVVILAVILLVPVITAGVGCICYMYILHRVHCQQTTTTAM